MGGFGNQLFQLCFANNLKKIGHHIALDISNYYVPNDDSIERRELVLPSEYFGFTTNTKKTFNFWTNIYKYRQNNFRNFPLLPLKKFNDVNYIKGSTGKMNFFVGYWQDVNLILNNKDFLYSSLSHNRLIKEGLDYKSKPGKTLLHIRRGDYLQMGEALSIEYYKNAIRTADKEIKEFEYEIFTDDIDWVKNHSVFQSASNIHYSSASREDTINAFSKMLMNNNFIISNSTFSLIPAILKENKTSKIISPFPWYRNSNKIINLREQWIKLDNNG